MKKIIFVMVLVFVVGFGTFYYMTDFLKPSEMLSELESSKISNESYLDILVDMVEYEKDDVENYKLLEVAMRIARELDLVKSKTEPVYLEYVPKETVHKIIEELTGIKVTEPIREEDFYYLYDDENDYYYIVPIGTDWIHCGKIYAAIKQGNSYVIECDGVRSDYDGGYEVMYDHMMVKLHKRDNYKYIKYRLERITGGEMVLNENKAGGNYSSLNNYSFVPQYVDKTLLLTFTYDNSNEEAITNLANKLATYYQENPEAYRDTRLFIVPCSYENKDILQDFSSNLDIDSVIEFQIGTNTMIGDASLAEIFEEEMDLTCVGNFEANADSTMTSFISFASWTHENGIESLLVEFADDNISFDNLVNALDKII